ncbi:DUF7224 domain-containing protein [Streptomyces marianii]|uniref:DUF7224 domain-containing protein n=1 Tax=Streptomyces marianii TaxID=1817406 RepID=A0A5R9E3Z6_9ACTN|nr:hypothetical protein [Streptomyces marianii]TLQ44681.1 hypothetical protein FEF34_17665 [Streptomyces marianii]
MITWANLRSSAALWLALPALFYAGLYIDDVTYTAPSRYGVESGELAAYGMAIIAPAVAGAAAWEAGRHRLLGALRIVGARRLPHQLFRAVTPVLILHLLLIVGALVMARRAVGVWPGDAGWLAVAHLVVLPLGWMIIGWCLGEVLPRSIAAPIAGIGCWAWLSVPHTLATAWVRHLGGFIDGTSTVTDVRLPAAYAVPWAVVAGMGLALWLFVHMRRRAWGAAVGVLVLAITFVTGRIMVADWGYQRPTSPRSVAMTCVGDAPRVCVPPEYKQYAEQLRRDALVPLARLKAAGLTSPQELRITSDTVPLKPGTWPLFWSLPPLHSQADPDQYAVSLAQSAVVGTAARAGTDCRQGSAVPSAWAALVIGVDEPAMRQAMLDTDWAALQEVRRLPAKEQLDWFGKAAASGEPCSRGVS